MKPTTHPAPDPLRSARGNAALIHLDFESVLETAFSADSAYDFLLPAIQQMASLRTTNADTRFPAISIHPDHHIVLAHLLNQALDTAKQLPPASPPTGNTQPSWSTVLQTITRIQKRALRVADLTAAAPPMQVTAAPAPNDPSL